MSDIKMTAEVRTDFDAEANGLPAERWAEAVFNVDGQEIVLEVSVEEDIIISIIPGEEKDAWKGTLTGLKEALEK